MKKTMTMLIIVVSLILITLIVFYVDYSQNKKYIEYFKKRGVVMETAPRKIGFVQTDLYDEIVEIHFEEIKINKKCLILVLESITVKNTPAY